MRQNALSPLWLAVLAVGVAAVLGLGLAFMPRLLAATTYTPPTATPTSAVPAAEPEATATEAAEVRPTPEPPTPMPTSALREAPEFTLAGGKGVSISLAEQLADGPVVIVFFPRVGG
jgi:hypothetical protein